MSQCCCDDVTIPDPCTGCSTLPATGMVITVTDLDWVYYWPPLPNYCDPWHCTNINGSYLATQSGEGNTLCQWTYRNAAENECGLVELKLTMGGTSAAIEMLVRVANSPGGIGPPWFDMLVRYTHPNIPPTDCASLSALPFLYSTGSISQDCRVATSMCFVSAVN